MANPRPVTMTLVVNPAAAHGRGAQLLPKVTAELVSGLPAVKLQVVRTTDPRHAFEACQEAVAHSIDTNDSADSLLVMGGDGMMHLGLNAAAGTDVPLGLIPAGRGNDFCRGVGIPVHGLGAIRAITEGHSHTIDLMSVTGQLIDGQRHRWVGSIVSTGFDARVNYRTNNQRFHIGSLGYAAATLAELSRFEPLPYRLIIDGEPWEQTAMFVAVGNAGWFGGGMQACPQADVNDGLLDVTIINPVSRATLLRLLPSMYSGSFVKDPAVEQVRAATVVVDGDGLYGMADGEELGDVPLTLRAVPHALRLYLPGPQ